MSLFLRLHTACHQRRLCGMESGDCTAGNRNEHEAPDRFSIRMHICEMSPDLRNGICRVGKDTKDNTNCHNDQANTKQRIDPSNDLINRNKGCNKIVCQNNPQPYLCTCKCTCDSFVFQQSHDQSGRSYCKHCTYHNQKDNTEYSHDVLHRTSKIDTTYLRNRCAIISFRKHT